MELIGHDGKAHNITLQPGEMLMYESHSVIHGRPFELKGRYVANLFLHFELEGHSLDHHDHNSSTKSDGENQYRKAIEQGNGGRESVGGADDGLPPYLLPDSPAEPVFRQEHSDHSNSVVQTLLIR